jgi:hypothetical protein
MPTIYQTEDGVAPYAERVEASSVIEIDAEDRDHADRIAQHVLAAASAVSNRGPLRIDTGYDEHRKRLTITLAGCLPAMDLLNHHCEADERLFNERTPTSAVIEIDPIARPFASSLEMHMTACARNHPQTDLPLRINTGYDAARQLATFTFSGSIFAVSYFFTIIHVRLAQRMNREARHA